MPVPTPSRFAVLSDSLRLLPLECCVPSRKQAVARYQAYSAAIGKIGQGSRFGDMTRKR